MKFCRLTHNFVSLGDFASWFDLTQYVIRPEALSITTLHLADMSDDDVIASFISSNDYRITYMGTEPSDKKGINIHGPVSLDSVSFSSFDPVSYDSFTADVEEFFHACSKCDDDVEWAIPVPSILQKNLLLQLLRSDNMTVFHLRIDRCASHDISYILMDFREYLIIDRARDIFSVAICGID